MTKISRRTFLSGTAAALSAPAGFALANSGDNPPVHSNLPLKVEEYEVPLAHIDPSFDGLRIGFLTDFHYGIAIEEEFLEQSVRAIADRNVDLLLLGGDYMWIPDSALSSLLPCDRNQKYVAAEQDSYLIAEEVIRDIGREISKYDFPDGVMAVIGNHDRWLLPEATIRAAFSKYGIEVLINELRALRRPGGGQNFTVYGVDDHWTGLPKAYNPGAKEKVDILLSHNPDFAVSCADSFKLCLSGHTHGGQIVLPALGAMSYNIRHERYGAGQHPIESSSIITSRGLGVVELPIRYNCPPEASIITVRYKP